MTARPNVTLTMEHVPLHCRRARTALLGPLTPADLDAASFVNYKQGGHLSTAPLHEAHLQSGRQAEKAWLGRPGRCQNQ